jgi:hypothetical protein
VNWDYLRRIPKDKNQKHGRGTPDLKIISVPRIEWSSFRL